METTLASQVWADNSSFHMIDVGEKLATKRLAEAEGEIVLSHDAFFALKENRNPKGNVLALAEAAGIMAAKRTSDFIPLCHSLPLSSVHLKFILSESTLSIKVFCEARTTAQTGVEMEALCGVNGALLTIYDLSKAVDPLIEIKNIRLNFKEGGKSGVWKNPNYKAPVSSIPNDYLKDMKATVITVSDRVSAGKAEDRSGPDLCLRIENECGKIISKTCVADRIEEIQKVILQTIEKDRPHFILTTGGTGLSPRDVTPEALEQIAQRRIAGFGELLRQEGAKHIKTAWLSRSIACVIQDTLVVALPGSSNACREAMDVLLPILKHAVHTLSGGNHDSV
jgi:cyclic pyranopterin phosphate synthase